MSEDIERETQTADAPADPGVTVDNTDAAPPAPEIIPGESTPHSPAAGVKKPGSILEALTDVKLEEPAEAAAGAQTEPQPGEAPTPETEAAKAALEAAGKDDAGKPKPANAAADALSQSFNNRPEWKAAKAALGEEGFKKARPIIRQLMESEQRVSKRAAELEPRAAIADEFRSHAGDEQGFNTMRTIVRTYATDPAAAVPILEQMLTDARQRGGLELVSADLKADLAEISMQAEDGLLEPARAEKAKARLIETEKSRAAARRAQGQLKQNEQARASQDEQAALRLFEKDLNDWEASTRTRCPDFGVVTDANDPEHGTSVADQVFDALCLKRIADPAAKSEALLREAERVLRLALRRVGAPAAREQRVITSQRASASAKAKPKTMREAMDAVRLD